MTRLLLIGGGHSHLFVLEALGRLAPSQRAGIKATLVTRELHTPYSGMLPGLVAGHYAAAETHIDLLPPAAHAGVDIVQARIGALDPLARRARADDGRGWDFDVVSIDIGSTPPVWQVSGAAAHALPVKPVGDFLAGWQRIQALATRRTRVARLVVVGAGAGGVELALAMAYRMKVAGVSMHCTLLGRSLLGGYPARAARLAMRRMQEAGIDVFMGAEVKAVEEGRLHLNDGRAIAHDALIWATGAGAQPWLAQSGLACRDGFIEVDDCLRSTSHAQVFAAGDAASHAGMPWLKSGVIAVRQGPILAENLLRSMRGEPLLAYHAQRSHLALISTGGRHAIACWRGMAWQGDWVWKWKDAIDRRFIERFSLSAARRH
ncbi:FAD-dependent oxidoreductase [Noviherbaspirillum pedocola]|uniref:FAD-dependent oxidoreductase n=1 Tax=Noviherbaspirillum pedocola TaxID=2801341 RepID=A0A934SXU4_9BURK|nr:FAD-dependent oxidoreductase [Noviherbaspirillum pedocola]MBK4734867.1 FAD-dependent oxidoreductase [Noviherbaspirillum pedocola]